MPKDNWVEETAKKNALAIGRIVHVSTKGMIRFDGVPLPACWPAIVTRIAGDRLTVHIFTDGEPINATCRIGDDTYHFYQDCPEGL